MRPEEFDWFAAQHVERAHVAETKQSPGDTRTDYERDRARIIHSVAFRNLQGKTQVFATGRTADILRTRVTHSIEVAQIDRALAQNCGVPEALVEAACLGHDLGHPPFGHTGEQVLNHVMEEHGDFEGNAQTFRIVTYLEQKHPRLRGPGPHEAHASLAGEVPVSSEGSRREISLRRGRRAGGSMALPGNGTNLTFVVRRRRGASADASVSAHGLGRRCCVLGS